MSEALSPDVPELPPESVAEIESALLNGVPTDLHVLVMVEGLHAVWHAVGADECHDTWWPVIVADKESVDLDDEVALQRFMDRTRDWVKHAAEETCHWIWAHDLPHIHTYFLTAQGLPRFIMLEAKAPPV